MAMDWVLTWARTAFISISRKNIPPRREEKAFDSQKEPVNFAMSLDVPQRRTVQLHLPDGDIAELLVVEQMYAQHQKDK
jgi:hypothetical protein